MPFGTEIRRLREKHNVSAQLLADAVGIDAERLRAWEKKDLTPKSDDTKKIEDYFGMSLEKLMSQRELPKVPTKEEVRHLLTQREIDIKSPRDEFVVTDDMIPPGLTATVDEQNLTMHSLARSLELSAQARLVDSESRKIEAKNMERMITLLEMRFSSGNEVKESEAQTSNNIPAGHQAKQDFALDKKARVVKG